MYNIERNRQDSFHGLELKEAYRILSMLIPQHEAKDLLKVKLTGELFKDQIFEFLDSPIDSEELKDLKIAYYLASNCGINRIIRLLNTSQTRVYRIKEALEDEAPLHPLRSVISIEPMFVHRLQDLISLLNILDGFRFLEPMDNNHYLQGQVRSK